MAKTPWTTGDTSGSQTLTSEDHLYESHINELRTSVNNIEDLSHYGDMRNASDFDSIQDAVDDLPATGGVVYIPAGTHTITDRISLPVNTCLKGAGEEKTIIYLDDNSTLTSFSGNYGIIVTNQDNCAVSDLTLNGNKTNQTQTTQHGIFAISADYFRVNNVKVIGTVKRGIYFSSCDWGKINHCYIRSTGERGIVLEGSNYNLISDNHIYNAGEHGLSLGVDSNHNIVDANIIATSAYFSIGVADASDFNIISNNSLVGGHDEGVQITSSRFNRVVNNVISTVYDDFGISVEARSAYGATFCDFTYIAGNTINGTYSQGIALLGTRWCTVTGNHIYDTCTGGTDPNGAIFLDSTTSGNIITSNTVIDDRATKIHKYGIRENTGGNKNIITGNYVRGYLTSGVSTTGANTVTDNNIEEAA